MKKTFCFFLCLMFFAPVAGQSRPVIADPPIIVENDAFRTWERITIIYPIRYLDGYVLILEELDPQKMSFLPFQVESYDLGKVERKEEENYRLLSYTLRYMGPKKGTMEIQSQIIPYEIREPGKVAGEFNVGKVETEKITLVYQTSLTEEVDDIYDEINLGSSRTLGLVLVYGSLVVFLLFAAAIPISLFISPSVDKKRKKKEESEIYALRGRHVYSSFRAVGKFKSALKEIELRLKNNPLGYNKEIDLKIYMAVRIFLLSKLSDTDNTFSTRQIILAARRDGNKFRGVLLEYLTAKLEQWDTFVFSDLEKRTIFNNSDLAANGVKNMKNIANNFSLFNPRTLVSYSWYLSKKALGWAGRILVRVFGWTKNRWRR